MTELITCPGCGASVAVDAEVTHQLWMSSGHPVPRDTNGIPDQRERLMTRPWRLGQSWNAKDPERSPLVTLVEIGDEPEDEQGHRADDVLLGALFREDAAEVLEVIRRSVDPDAAQAYVRGVLMEHARQAGEEAVREVRSWGQV